MLSSTVNLLKTLALSSGIHADVMQTEATRTLCGLLRMLVESGTSDQTGNLTPHFDFHKRPTWRFHLCVCVCVSGCQYYRLVSREQHRSWCTLGFIRSIALMPQMCSTLSSLAWINLLIRIVEGHQSFTAVTLQRQVYTPHCQIQEQNTHSSSNMLWNVILMLVR